LRAFSSNITTSGQGAGSDISRHSKLQFSKEKLTEFGELPCGQIPDALRYDRASSVTKLDNGIRVATEAYNNTSLVTLGFYWTFGSRHESPETSGICNFIQRLQFKGTESRTREQIQNELQVLGGKYNTVLERERVGLQITVAKDQVSQAVSLVSDMLLNTQYNAQQVEAEREVVRRSIIELSRDQMETTMENLYYTSYRDHHQGQPVRGIRENVGSIGQADIRQWVDSNCVGKNLVVVATGDVSHEQVSNEVTKNFGQLAQSSGTELANMDKPIYTPSMMFMRDDEMANLNVTMFFNAPTYTNEDYWAMRFMNVLMGEYREDLHTGANLNATDRQYSELHKMLGNLPDISIHKSFYEPSGDNALFGSYLHGNEVHGPQMLYVSQLVASEYGYQIGQAEIFRARSRYFNDLLNANSGNATNSEVANEAIHFGRVVPRSEKATRISNVAEQKHLQRVCSEWFWDKDITGAVWGPQHAIASLSSYNRNFRRSTLGWYGMNQFNTN